MPSRKVSPARLVVAGVLLLLPVSLAWVLPDAAFTEGTAGRGSLRFRSSIPVLHLYGTSEEMGTQYGALLKGAIERTYRDVAGPFLSTLGGASARDRLRIETKPMQASVPPSIMEEMKAVARAAHIDESEFILFNLMFDVAHGGKRIGGCTTVAVAGAATATGEPLMGRNFDLDKVFFGLAPLGIVVVRHPTAGIAWASVTHPAFLGTHGGINERGLAAGATAGQPGRGFDPRGISSMMLFRRVLEEASTAKEAEQILRGARVTVATTLMVMDAKGGNFVAELSPERVAFRRPEAGTLYETNHFEAPELREDVACPRFAWLAEHFKSRRRLDVAGMRGVLAGIGQSVTIQSMIFLPARRAMEVSTGTIPATSGAYVPFSSEDLFPTH
jgi:hypothetical protein